MKVVMVGLKELQAQLESSPKQATKRLAGPMFTEAERIMTRAKKLAPVDEGTLQGSGTVRQPRVTGIRVTVEMGFGGAALKYAMVQHERLDYKHTSGQAKFLEQPVNEAVSGFAARIGKSLDLFK